ncbi:bifunctional DnaJ domain/DnaJ domain [Babesia duncani]|uniref:Bifunctional DnaJ domain/DnaJ domain n=1 Tax=Babesia duncani TaxID=323732 RepID=A0AAD9PHH1_9APIC|nr:bifunctional DnaJ domain/DnaJ domain [Babesia duncani]
MTLDNETCYYKILGLEPTCNQNDIRRAYHKSALANHPDKQPLQQQEHYKAIFQKIQQAYECLSDPKSRAIYDRYRTSDSDLSQEHIDLSAYFGCCFVGYDIKSPKNFYAVYELCFRLIHNSEPSSQSEVRSKLAFKPLGTGIWGP